MEQIMQILESINGSYVDTYIGLLRYIAPALAIFLLWRCLVPLVSFKREPEIWAWLQTDAGNEYALTHWENVIGRSKSSDVCIDFPTISRNHAVLTRYDDGSWTITDAGSKGGVSVNGQAVQICALEPEDVINIGGLDMKLVPISAKQEQLQASLRTKASSGLDSVVNLLILSVFQCMLCLGFLLGAKEEVYFSLIQGFGGIMACQWLLLIFYGIIRRSAFEVETAAFFLCTVGMAVIATVKPGETDKQLFALILGIVTYLFVGWSMRDLERAKRFRYLAVVAGVAFLAVTLVFGTEYYGAQNWLIIGGM